MALLKQLVLLLFTIELSFAAEPVIPKADLDQTVAIIKSIDVCQKKYVSGKYDCRHFAADFEKEGRKKGLPTCTLNFGCDQKNIHLSLGYKKQFRHEINIVQTPYAASQTLKRFCAVDPQGGIIIVCWIAEKLEPLPERVKQSLRENYEASGFDSKSIKAWGEDYEIRTPLTTDPAATKTTH